MDKRLELTEKQKGLVEQLAKLIQNMKKEEIGIVADMEGHLFNGFMFYNSSEVIDTDSCGDILDSGYEGDEGYSEESYHGEEAEDGQIWYTPNSDDLDYVSVDVDQFSDDDCWFSVLLEKDEEMDIFNKKREKAQKLAPLMEKRGKLEKKMKRFVDGLAEGEENLQRLEEKGLPQGIIDEEKVKVESTRTELEKLNAELNELDKEIKKVKAIKTK